MAKKGDQRQRQMKETLKPLSCHERFLIRTHNNRTHQSVVITSDVHISFPNHHTVVNPPERLMGEGTGFP